ncbi:TetR/AcrR family transcriptional regulator [Chitinibacter sp. ZOR0017]|uniref:TetR/AcrR family transcriptional regulator n=1 Tax=Chitinibacter sp. ZOR0017 TaxID=1339254 RepID=UPI0018CC9DD3|nr:TetR/AcrR family transcriptional regulator [Chitinibacter sp. ZOR0017]
MTTANTMDTPDSSSDTSNTRSQILYAAMAVLIEVGQAAFTTRRVAERAGISLGNLTYHFPSKQRLVQAMIGELLAQYQQRFEQMLASKNVQNSLNELINWLMVDAIDKKTVHLFRELWSLSLHDEEIAIAMDTFYTQSIALTAQLLQQNFPKASPAAVNELVTLLAVATEGCIVLYGNQHSHRVSHSQLIALIQKSAKNLIRQSI